MNYKQINGFMLDENYIVIDRVMYRLENLDTEEMVEAICNKGDALPLVQGGLRDKQV